MGINLRLILGILLLFLVGFAIFSGINLVAGALADCDSPPVGSDIYLLERSFIGFRGVVQHLQYHEGYPPILALRTHQGSVVYVECMNWQLADGDYLEGTPVSLP